MFNVNSNPDFQDGQRAPSPELGQERNTPFGASVGRRKGGRKTLLIAVIAAFIFLFTGAGIFAYTQGLISLPFALPFASNDAKAALLRSIQKVAMAENGEYGFSLELVGEPRAVGAQPLKVSDFLGGTSATMQKKDQETYANAHTIQTALELFYADNVAYPETLNQLAEYVKTAIPKQGNDEPFGYAAINNKQDYTLTFQYLTGSSAGPLSVHSGHTVPAYPSVPDTSALSPISSVISIDDMVGYIPADINFKLSASVFTNSIVDDLKARKGIFNASGSYSSGGTTLNGALEIRINEGKIYVNVKQFPSLFFFDLGAIKDKWVEIDPENENNSLGIFSINVNDVGDKLPNKNSTKTLREELPHLLQIAFDEKAITAEFGEREKLDGVQTRRIVISFDPDKYSAFVDAYLADAQRRAVNAEDIKTFLESIKRPEVIEQNKQFLATTTLTLWVAESSNEPKKLVSTLIIVPPDRYERLKDRQFRVSTGLTFANLGTTPNVQVPADTITLDEAERLLSGTTLEEQQFDKQNSAIQDIRSALNMYRADNKQYPENLSTLLIKPAQNSNTSQGYFYSRKTVPVDIYTGQPFSYQSSGTDYRLVYTIKLPKDEQKNSLFGTSDYYRAQYVEGVNTSTKDAVSLEADAQKDTDKDGLTDAEEAQYGTNKYNPDTDGDGYLDGEEVRNGYNPLAAP